MYKKKLNSPWKHTQGLLKICSIDIQTHLQSVTTNVDDVFWSVVFWLERSESQILNKLSKYPDSYKKFMTRTTGKRLIKLIIIDSFEA